MIFKKILLLGLFQFILFSFFAQSNPCVNQNEIRVIVLGSSTAAGSGVSTSDSAWVNRYRDYLEALNPNNEVINLANGGYTTYKIMRTGFVPPPGRPNPDPAKNITAALALNPDAIIVNMPSNDVSQGFSYQEQIDNLDSIVAFSNTSAVPIWICTTQPKNYSNSALQQLQFDIKDSILQFYSPNAIDFWTTIALPDHSIDPFFDSGDGTHLNDAGHAILKQRVVDANLPTVLYSPTLSVDYSILEASPNGMVGCGDSLTAVTLIMANVGISETSNTEIILAGINETNGGLIQDTAVQLGGINSCETDTFQFIINTYQAGIYKLQFFHNNLNDTTHANDSLTIFLESLGHPSVIPLHDTLCEPGLAQLSAVSDLQDTVFWYAQATDSIPVGFGPTFSTGLITGDTTFYVETVRGDLFYKKQLETTLSSNINWNGAMFDIVAMDSIVLDSFFVKINTLGSQVVEIYTKSGSHLGFETNPNAWTQLGTASVFVNSNQGFTSVPLGNISLSISDTIGVYIQMANPNSQISYQSMSSPLSRFTNEIELMTGSGVSHNFSANYYPRDLNCGVHYHYGDRPDGDCTTGKIPVHAFVSNTFFNLGADTIVDIDDTLHLSAPIGYSNYNWSTGQTNDSIEIVASQLGWGVHFIAASFIDSLGCLKGDTIVVAIANLVGLENLSKNFNFYPNPSQDYIHFNRTIEKATIYSPSGQSLNEKFGSFDSISVIDLPAGIYFLEVQYEDQKGVVKFFKGNDH